MNLGFDFQCPGHYSAGTLFRQGHYSSFWKSLKTFYGKHVKLRQYSQTKPFAFFEDSLGDHFTKLKTFYGKHVKVLQYSQIKHPIGQGKD